ncbi:hypothetical protein [Arthrobacter bussei]|uniref:hypothetical protein n=1 Tax=Arthrobacter bussei TaxID=2594179 RepID=UPI00128DA92F|nr:hypothetical protein [Arthrobacter bussei]
MTAGQIDEGRVGAEQEEPVHQDDLDAQVETGTRTSRTGDRLVDDVLGSLDRLAGLPVDDHAAVLLEVHDRLGGVLAPEQALRPGGAHGAP